MEMIYSNYIEKREENELIDFKFQFYSKENKSDLIKDILSFANNCNNQNKFIIFGYDNVTNKYNDICYDDIEDISCYNQLINEFCDPFIDIAIDKFEYKTHKMAALIIKISNTNRPFIVKRDYTKNEKFLLRKGEIYIRKNANNFICAREDLDKIYDSRRQVTIKNQINELLSIKVRKGVETTKVYGIMMNIINNSQINLAINDIEVAIKYSTNCFCLKSEYVEDYSQEYKKELLSLKTQALVIPRESQLSKVIIFEISQNLIEIVTQKFKQNETPIVTVTFLDLEEKKYRHTFELKTIESN